MHVESQNSPVDPKTCKDSMIFPPRMINSHATYIYPQSCLDKAHLGKLNSLKRRSSIDMNNYKVSTCTILFQD